MPTPFVLQATLQLPPDVGLPQASVGLAVSSQFDCKADFDLQLTGAGTHAVDLGTATAPGLKGLLIKVDASATAAPITLLVNGAIAGGFEIAPGGGLGFASPNPVTGITSLDIVHTTAVTVRIWALG